METRGREGVCPRGMTELAWTAQPRPLQRREETRTIIIRARSRPFGRLCSRRRCQWQISTQRRFSCRGQARGHLLTVVSRGHENPWERVEVCDRIGLRETIRSLRYLPAGKRMGKMMQKARDDSESADSLSGKNPPLRLRQFMQRSRWRSTGTGDHQVA